MLAITSIFEIAGKCSCFADKMREASYDCSASEMGFCRMFSTSFQTLVVTCMPNDNRVQVIPRYVLSQRCSALGLTALGSHLLTKCYLTGFKSS